MSEESIDRSKVTTPSGVGYMSPRVAGLATKRVLNAKTKEIPKIYTVKDGVMTLNLHPGQLQAWNSNKRYVVILSGTQGGKTSFGPLCLYKWMQEAGPGDYIVAGPSFKLLNLKALPEFRRFFEYLLKLGEYRSSPTEVFTFSKDGLQRTFGRTDEPTQVFFGHADNPDSLESATAKAAWLDEAGQKRFRVGSFEAIMRRLSLAQGRVLITTTPYDLGWIKQKMHDPYMKAKAEGREHPDIELVRFDSTENPAFPQEEFERAKRDMPLWKFNLFYRAIFTQPAGMIYDSFKNEPYPQGHLVNRKRFPVPSHWPRWIGMDFGLQNLAAVFIAEELDVNGVRTGRLVLYRVYRPGVNRSAEQHVREILKGEPTFNGLPKAYGGSHTEYGWRQAFKSAGLPVYEPPVNKGSTATVEAQIDCVYGAHARDELLVMDDLEEYLDEKMSYSREVDEMGNVGDKIDDQNTFHIMDAERYILAKLKPMKVGVHSAAPVISAAPGVVRNEDPTIIDAAPAGFLDELQRVIPTSQLKQWHERHRSRGTHLS